LGPMMASKPYFTNPVVDEVVAAALTIVIFSKNMRLHKDVVLDSDDAIFFFLFFFLNGIIIIKINSQTVQKLIPNR
jgi:hypothetical protein